ncbi:MAG: dockerin type I domain-containing protein [Candidatus Zixiibacteriota bacterium]
MARNHKSSKVVFTITNFGMFGAYQEPMLPDSSEFYPGCEYPQGSGVLHCYQGALWIGAIVGNDTLVSVGADGWQNVFEMYPDMSPGEITRQSNRQNDPDFDSSAIADEEFVAVYFDTLSDPAITHADPFEARPHIPLGLKIRQHSYSFGDSPDDDFILLRYTITNVGSNYLNGVYVATYFDTDIWHTFNRDGFRDDFTGSRWVSTFDGTDSLLVGYAADNDGDPSAEGEWNQYSARSVFSATVLDPTGSQNNGFNWWISNATSCFDWGPRLLTHDRPFGTEAVGTPAGDRNKYYVMSNPEIDFNQLWAGAGVILADWFFPTQCLTHPYMDDIRFLMSFGGSDLAPGDSMQFALAIVLGENLHANPEDWSLFDSLNPEAFYNTLNFADLDGNVREAQRLYRQLFYGIAGDFDNSGTVDLKDVVAFVNYLFAHGTAPQFRNAADVNGDCRINLSDIVLLVRYLYHGGSLADSGCVE